jgi:hypothetical protein
LILILKSWSGSYSRRRESPLKIAQFKGEHLVETSALSGKPSLRVGYFSRAKIQGMCVSMLARTDSEFMFRRFSDRKTISELGCQMLPTRIGKL